VLAWSGKHRSSRRGGRFAAALREAVEEEDELGDDSGRLRDVLGVQEEEGGTARRFLALAWLGVDHSFVYVELRKASMAGSMREEENERGEEKTAAEKGLGFGGSRRTLFIGPGSALP
jgi:hypothetical protein